MGIKDLLRFMKPYTEAIHIQKFAGKRVGIDAYSWLHKGAYSCSMELSLNTEGDKKLQYINYFMHRINLLRHHQITPVVVFDGGNIPCKAATENERYKRRKANKELAMEKLSQGNLNAAIELFQRAISITPSMAHLLIQTLKSENVEFLVAPYEADAQLAYLSSLGEENGGICTIVSEDSDLLAYGCPSVVFKMDRFGNGEEIVLDKVFKSTNSKPSFRNFNTPLFIDMCVLAGCDFLPSIPGIGIAKAHALVSKYRNTDRVRSLFGPISVAQAPSSKVMSSESKIMVLSVLKLQGKQVPDDYARSFKEAIAVFQHATIYNRNTKRIEHMKELPDELLESLGDVDFLGPDLPPSIATAIAEGKLDPSTMEAYDCHVQTSQQRESSLVASQKSIERNMLGEVVDITHIFNRKNYKVPELPKPVQSLEVDVDKEKQAQSCFTVYSSASMRDENISNTNTMMVGREVLKERNYTDEAATLAKLAIFSEVDNNAEELTVSEVYPVKTPDNNPFRKRKFDSENASETTPSMKSSVTHDDQLESSQKIHSQDSVKSKVLKIEHSKEQVQVVGKRKISSCKNSGSKNSSILNFFNRI